MTGKKGKSEEQIYMGSQLLKMERYDNRIARILLDENGRYSMQEADKIIEEYMKKKG